MAVSSSPGWEVAVKTTPPSQLQPKQSLARWFVVAWVLAVVFYFLEYAARSAPSVMVPQLATMFHTTVLGVSSILAVYYYTYSTMSLVAGAALDHLGAKHTIPIGVAVLALGCLLFSAPLVIAGDIGRLLQGAGSAFAFTGAVYLAVHGFPARYLATAVGFTQCVGMLGGSAGQFAVGPMIERGVSVHVVWIGLGVLCFVNAVVLFLVTPREDQGLQAKGASIIKPYKVVFSNPQSYVCGIIAGLLFAPTTIGDMIWGVASLKDQHFTYHNAVITAAMVPMGWVIGCPLLGWLSDFIGRRKPVIIGGAAVMALAVAQIAFVPALLPAKIALLIFGIGSGAAMIPYSSIKEANPDDVKGSATGGINFLVFGITAIFGPIYANLIGRVIGTTADHTANLHHGGWFWIICCLAAIIATLFLRETGRAVRPHVVQP